MLSVAPTHSLPRRILLRRIHRLRRRHCRCVAVISAQCNARLSDVEAARTHAASAAAALAATPEPAESPTAVTTAAKPAGACMRLVNDR